MRFAKSPGQSQKGARKKLIVYTIVNPGERVDEKKQIGTQKRYDHHPGLNVGVNPRDKSLYAMCAGTVYYSVEPYNPNPRNPVVQQYYKEGVTPKFVKYIHVVPDKAENKFRMIDII